MTNADKIELMKAMADHIDGSIETALDLVAEARTEDGEDLDTDTITDTGEALGQVFGRKLIDAAIWTGMVANDDEWDLLTNGFKKGFEAAMACGQAEPEACPDCGGDGLDKDCEYDTCKSCDGTGELMR